MFESTWTPCEICYEHIEDCKCEKWIAISAKKAKRKTSAKDVTSPNVKTVSVTATEQMKESTLSEAIRVLNAIAEMTLEADTRSRCLEAVKRLNKP